jgi:hypothetical protein
VSAIDRRALVARHAVEVTGVDPRSPLSVGNGELCCTVDVTGLQTFPGRYPVAPAGTLLGTLTQWAWHSLPPPVPTPALAGSVREYDSPHGPVGYVDLDNGEPSPEQQWLRANPHRLDLVRIGFVGEDARAPSLGGEVRQRLDLWTGVITSAVRLGGDPVEVVTCCHPRRDVLGFRVVSPGLAARRVGVRVAFPYGSPSWNDAADWTRPEAHRSVPSSSETGYRIDRELDGTRLVVWLRPGPGTTVQQTGEHEFVVWAERDEFELAVGFDPAPGAEPPPFAEVLAASAAHWPRFWESGGAVDLGGSADPRAPELERRIVLSQYLTAIHCAGSLPPQETGLMVNSWHGKFHLEMHWWHGAHFALWNRTGLLTRNLSWYSSIVDRARATARRQGFAGARWPKQVGPDGRESPSPIAPFLLWQQPHPIHLAELVRRARGDEAARRYTECVLESAAFMADVVVATEAGYALAPPLVPAQESYYEQRATTANPTFELAYWAWALRVAQEWRVRLGLPPDPLWTKVAENLVPPHVLDGRYTAIGTPPWTVRADHPSMLYALGVVPDTGLVDAATMRATLHDVLSTWDWESAWGWDFPATAMTAVRLGEPHTAVDTLLLDTPKNTYLPNGHNRQTDRLPVYLPGNGGLLAAVALMAAGWDGDGGRPSPGFPDDGTWTVRHEGLVPSP